MMNMKNGYGKKQKIDERIRSTGCLITVDFCVADGNI